MKGHLTEDEVRARVRAWVAEHDSTYTELAKKCGISGAHLSGFMHGRKKPPPDLLNLFRMDKVVYYKAAA